MSERLTRRHAWHALSGFFAIPLGVAGLFLAAPLLAGAASPGLAAGPGMGSPPPTVNPCVLHLTAVQMAELHLSGLSSDAQGEATATHRTSGAAVLAPGLGVGVVAAVPAWASVLSPLRCSWAA